MANVENRRNGRTRIVLAWGWTDARVGGKRSYASLADIDAGRTAEGGHGPMGHGACASAGGIALGKDTLRQGRRGFLALLPEGLSNRQKGPSKPQGMLLNECGNIGIGWKCGFQTIPLIVRQ